MCAKMIKNISRVKIYNKIFITLVFTLLCTVFLYQGWYKPKSVQAAISAVTDFTAAPLGTGTTGGSVTATFAGTGTTGTNSNRMLIVAVHTAYGAVPAATPITSVTYGGTGAGNTLTMIAQSDPTQRRIVTLYYLSEVGVAAKADNTVTVTLSTTSLTGTHIYAACYQNVIQAAPTPTYSNFINNTATPVTFGTGLSVPAGGYSVLATANNNAAAPTITGTAYTPTYSATETQIAASGNYSYVASRASASTETANPNLSWGATAIRAGVVGAVISPVPTGTTPTVTSTNPSSLGQGATNVNVTINGSNFVSGGSLLSNFGGNGVTVNSTSFVSSTQLTANLTLTGAATTGARTVTVTNGDGGGPGTLASGFTVNAAPTVTSTTPTSLLQGATSQVVGINGTGFSAGTPLAALFSGTGITVNSTTFSSATLVNANITVAAGATVGARDVTIIDGDYGRATGTGIFTVTASASPPTISAVTPNTLAQGATNTSVTIAGTNLTGGTVSFSNLGVTGGTPTVANATTITLPVSVTPAATPGLGTVTVTTAGGSVNSNFTVTAAPNPTVTTITPNTTTQGTANLALTIAGTNFLPGSTVTSFSGTGITINSSSYVSATQMTANITVSAVATTGARSATVTLPGGQTGSGGSLTINAGACTATVPTLSVSPVSASVLAGGAQLYTIRVTNNDNAFCGSTLFTPAVTNNNAASFTFTSPTASTLAPGAFADVTFTVTANAGAAQNASNISTVNVSAAGHTAPASVTATTTVNNTFTSPMMHSSNNYDTPTPAYGNWGSGKDCTWCHAPGSTNVKRIATTINTPTGLRNVVFNRMTAGAATSLGSFGNDERTLLTQSNQVCEVCHHRTKYHQYSTSKIAVGPDRLHNNRTDCTSCHPHNLAFKGAGGHSIPYYATTAGHTGCLSGVGCHTNGTVFTPYASITGKPDCRACHQKADPTTAGINCGSCHGASGGNGEPNATAHPDAVGSHPKHTATNACTVCHDTGGSGSNASHGPGNLRTNPAVVNLAASLSWNSGTSQCSTTCHSPYTSAVTTPAWGNASTGCVTCHNGVGAFISYSASVKGNAANPQQSGPNTGSHSAHMNYGRYTCAKCHTGAVTGTNGGLAHGDGNIDVTGQGYAVDVAKHAANSGYSTCSTLACHRGTAGTANPTWGMLTLGCIDCHNSAITRTKGRPGTTLAAVKAEFGLAWGHKRGAASTLGARLAVTDEDCVVCHLEGHGVSRKTSNFHADGNIDLRDPDIQGETPITNISNAAFTFARFSTSYAAGSRTATGNTSNTDIANVISQKFCLKCHDAAGAGNTTARTSVGSASMPFGGTQGANYTVANGAIAGGLVNIAGQFATTNRSKHPLLGARVTNFPTAARLSVPYNAVGAGRATSTSGSSVVMNCFDCHNVVGTPLTKRTNVAHGNAVTVRGVATVTGTPAATTNETTLCNVCHLTYRSTAQFHGAGSAWASNGNNTHTAYVEFGCNMCHASGYTTVVPRPIRGQDTHGSNTLGAVGTLIPTTTRWSTDPTPVALIRNRQIFPRHAPLAMAAAGANPAWTGGTQCMGGNVSPCSQGNEVYTTGGTY